MFWKVMCNLYVIITTSTLLLGCINLDGPSFGKETKMIKLEVVCDIEGFSYRYSFESGHTTTQSSDCSFSPCSLVHYPIVGSEVFLSAQSVNVASTVTANIYQEGLLVATEANYGDSATATVQYIVR